MNGLDMYDFGARQLDPAVPTWTTMDPMAEKYYSISPFAYCAGNPVRYVDPNGKEIWVGNVQYQAGMKYYGKDVFTKSVISALNLIYKSGGDKLVNDLIKSDSKYNYKENNSEKSSYTIQKDNGDVDINIKTDAPGGRDAFYSAMAHETMHGAQYENGQGGANIFNEVEANVFSQFISYNSMVDSSSESFRSMGSSFTSDKIGITYREAINNLSNRYSAFDMFVATITFKSGSAANFNGMYNNNYLLSPKHKKSLLKKYLK